MSDRFSFLIKQFLFIVLIISALLLTSCLGNHSPPRSSATLSPTTNSSSSSSSSSSRPSSGTNGKEISPSVDLRHLVDPFKGTYKTKVTIPKNYNGYLYISGLNVTSLSNKIVKVKFYFGREMEPITLEATVSRAQGLTPQTNIQVLVMDLRERPFENIRLMYDFYDYNQYSATSSPTQDTQDDNLYCRGLLLENDPTFLPVASKCDSYPKDLCPYSLSSCDFPGDKCLFAYAKIKDNGLYSSSNLAVIPTNPQVDSSGQDFYIEENPNESHLLSINGKNLTKCLPDNGVIYYKNYPTFNDLKFLIYDTSGIMAAHGSSVLSLKVNDELTNYTFQGPYRLVNQKNWVITPTVTYNSSTLSGAIMGSYGIFKGTMDNSSTSVDQGIYSLMFPRTGKMELKENIKYLGSDDPFISNSTMRDILSLSNPGESKWIDGCSIRALHYDNDNNESINSCNITAKIEVIYHDPHSGKDIVITSSNHIKLQLSRLSEKNYQGQEVLYQSMKYCASGRFCGEEECCYNNRCWSKNLVSQCLNDSESTGDFPVGQVCNSDYQCASLCCDQALGRCTVHDTTSRVPVYCSKTPGETCVAKEWCRRERVRDCRIIRTGITSTGLNTCSLRCYTRLEHGECINGVCSAPISPPVPTFDPNKPDCSKAQSPPLGFGGFSEGGGGTDTNNSKGEGAKTGNI